MKCVKCGQESPMGSKFCIGCGGELSVQTEVPNPASTNVGNTTSAVASKAIAPFNFFMFIVAAFLKPSQSFDEEKSKLDDVKNCMIFSGIIAVLMMVVNLVTNMITAVVQKTYSLFEGSYKTEIVWENLKELPYASLIFKNLLIYAVVILALAGIFFVGSLIAKKTITYIRSLAITAISMIPFIGIGMFLSTILGLIWQPLSVILVFIGFIYSITIFVSLLSKELAFDNKDYMIYYFAGCFSTVLIIIYFIVTKWLSSLLSNDSMLNAFSMLS